MTVKPIPEGYSTVTPYLIVDNLDALLKFVEAGFKGKTKVFRKPDGTPMHAELQIGNARVMAGQSGEHCAPIPAMLFIYVDKADDVYKAALAAGASKVQDMEDQMWGDRAGAVKDPSGNTWWIATHIEDLSEEEIARRAVEKEKTQKQRKIA